jgi:8-oxo-dGTP pyrophosphatase MutT (NUDIX family)
VPPRNEPESEPDLLCVGALIRDERHRVFVHRRSPTRKLFPGLWDVVGGHVDPGETVEQALAREIEEETGWMLRTVQARLPTWDWEVDGVRRREFDFLVEVDGDLRRPRLEAGKHDLYDWVGPDNLDLMLVGRTDGDRRLRDVVAMAVRTRLTERLCLVPAGPEHSWETEGVGTWMAYDRTTGELIGRRRSARPG